MRAFVLANDGVIRWLGEPIAKIAAGAHILQPTVRVLADDQLTGSALEIVQRRLDLWLAQHVKKLLGPLADLEQGEGLEGIARGIAFQVAEALGILERSKVAEEVKSLPQEARGALRKFGIRFGAYHLYLPNLVKPAPRALAAQLWALKNGGVEEVKGIDDVPHLAASGRTSFVADKDVPKGFYRAAGFRVCGERAVRVDILERLADLIRPAVAYRPGVTPGDPPAGAADGDGFVVTVAMTSLAGCSGENFASILRSLGYAVERREGPPITVPLLPKAATEPLAPHLAEAACSDEGSNAEENNVAAPVPEISENTESAIDAAMTPRDCEAGETAPMGRRRRVRRPRRLPKSRLRKSRLRKPTVRKWRLRKWRFRPRGLRRTSKTAAMRRSPWQPTRRSIAPRRRRTTRRPLRSRPRRPPIRSSATRTRTPIRPPRTNVLWSPPNRRRRS